MRATGIAVAGTAAACRGVHRDLEPIGPQRQERLLCEIALAEAIQGVRASGLVVPQRAVPNGDELLTFELINPFQFCEQLRRWVALQG